MSERRVALLGGLLAGLGPLSLALFTPAMPVMAEAFATSDTAVKATLSVYFAGYAGAQLVSGPLSDRHGRKPVTLAFLLIYLVGTLGTLLTLGIEVMLISRALQGIGAAAGLVISRAIVRDLFTGDASARVLNVTNILLGAGPAIAPAIGGAAMVVGGWRAPFVMMLLIGAGVILATSRWLVETHAPRARSESVLATYRTLVQDPYFLWSSVTIAGVVGTFYAQSTVLSFIIMSRLGHGPAGFGLVMLGISGAYFVGAVMVRFLIPRLGAARLVPFGLGTLVLSSGLLARMPVDSPTLPGVVVPVAVMVFSTAFILPGMYTACLAPFSRVAGAAAALSGFMTMGLGLVASVLIAWPADPVWALARIEPAIALIALASYILWWRQRPTQP